MTGKELQEILDQYKGWTGSRAEMLAIIEKIENVDPASRMLQSKKAPYKRLPINPRRIQWFTSKDIIPKPEGHKYHFEHLLFYWVAIILRKRNKFQFSQIEGLALREVPGSLMSLLSNPAGRTSMLEMDNGLLSELQRLGRLEGETSVSYALRFSITPWCQVMVCQNKLADLSESDVLTLSKAFEFSLRAEVQKNNLNNTD